MTLLPPNARDCRRRRHRGGFVSSPCVCVQNRQMTTRWELIPPPPLSFHFTRLCPNRRMCACDADRDRRRRKRKKTRTFSFLLFPPNLICIYLWLNWPSRWQMMSYRKKTRNDNNVPSDRQPERKGKKRWKRENKKEETCIFCPAFCSCVCVCVEVFYRARWDASRRYYTYSRCCAAAAAFVACNQSDEKMAAPYIYI